MKKVITLFSLLLMAAVQTWAELPTPKVEYVQLYANGPKWATMNLGATSVTDAGKYFWWGDVQGHADGDGFSFYYTNDVIKSYGSNKDFVADGQLVTEKDAATQQLGAAYRMPTKAEFDDLYNKCTWTWKTNYNGVDKANGYLVQGKGEYEDNSIFLPAAGSIYEKELESVGENGTYWSSTAHDDNQQLANCLFFSSDANIGTTSDGRDDGLPIRPVYDDPAQAAYDYLVSLIGDKEYANSFFRIHVNDEGSITRDIYTSSSFHPFILNDLEVNGNEYFFPTNGIKFVVEEAAIAHVCEIYNGEIIRVYTEAPSESELTTILGSNVYENAELSTEISVIDGYVTSTYDEGSTSLNSSYLLSKDGENYAFANNYNTFTFVVANGEVSEIVFKGYGGANFTYVKKASTPTAIDAIDADKAGKVTKTIENGKVVIIRNGERYDIAGRKL
ncbi:MAG: hypothetical protein MJZ27_10815 [Bacteroidales bacterium]|nr:hypothetical protein [Bacteroidales bacterium]